MPVPLSFRPDIAVPQEILDRSDVVVGLQQVSCKTVTKRMRGSAFEQFRFSDSILDGSLHIPFMDVISFFFSRSLDGGEGKSGENPLPDQFFGRVFILFIQPPLQEGAGVSGIQILFHANRRPHRIDYGFPV